MNTVYILIIYKSTILGIFPNLGNKKHVIYIKFNYFKT